MHISNVYAHILTDPGSRRQLSS